MEFPWDYTQGTGIAFLRDYGVPSIAILLDKTGEFANDGVKRYDDTVLFGEEASIEGVDSPRARAAVRRLNQIHGHYDIPNDEFQFVLATTIVGPVRWIQAYGWRDLDPIELQAIANFTTRFGTLMGIKDLPTTYAGYSDLLDSYERERFEVHPPTSAVADASLDIVGKTSPRAVRPLVRRVSIALMDEPLRVALGQPQQPAWFVKAVRGGLRLRGFLLHFASPRAEPYHPKPSTYPLGYRLGDLGPASMLDELNAKSTNRADARHAS